MKFKGKSVSVTITIPKNKIKAIHKLIPYAVDGYELKIIENPSNFPKSTYISVKYRRMQVETIQNIAHELGVLEKSRRTELVVLRSTLVYFLKAYYSGPTIARAFDWDDSTVVSCVKRYEDLKHYPDYQEASARINQLLKQHQPSH